MKCHICGEEMTSTEFANGIFHHYCTNDDCEVLELIMKNPEDKG